MLSLSFKNPLTDEQDMYLYEKFQDYPKKYEHDISADVDTKMSIYIGDMEIAKKEMEELKSIGYEFVGLVHLGEPFFHELFVSKKAGVPVEDTDDDFQLQYNEYPETPILERKPMVPLVRSHFTATSVALPELPSPQYVTVDQFESIHKKTQEQLNEFSIKMMSQVQAISASVARTAGFVHDHSSYASNVGPSSSSMSPSSPASQIHSTPISAQFRAKNELIANGIRCEKCGKTVRDVEPITKLMMAVREHVMTHFDSENPRLKRFECRECPDFKTNFVDDFEKHLKRHGSMSSLPEKRQKLTVNLLTPTHLTLITQLCNACFPDVFEKTPPQINTILAVDTPLRAKVSIFPCLDRLYCSKYNIPYGSNGRVSLLPTATIRID